MYNLFPLGGVYQFYMVVKGPTLIIVPNSRAIWHGVGNILNIHVLWFTRWNNNNNEHLSEDLNGSSHCAEHSIHTISFNPHSLLKWQSDGILSSFYRGVKKLAHSHTT